LIVPPPTPARCPAVGWWEELRAGGRELITMAGHASGPEQQPPTIDTSVPHSARIWNYWLGGKDNHPVDAEAGDEFAKTPRHRAATSRSATARTSASPDGPPTRSTTAAARSPTTGPLPPVQPRGVGALLRRARTAGAGAGAGAESAARPHALPGESRHHVRRRRPQELTAGRGAERRKAPGQGELPDSPPGVRPGHASHLARTPPDPPLPPAIPTG
jgi:hypothetical protein